MLHEKTPVAGEDTARYPLLAAGAAALLAAAVFWKVLSYGFVNLDDEMYVIHNSALSSPAGDLLRWAFTTYHAYNYHPLTWLSLAVDYRLWGLNPLGYHAASLLIHCLNCMLVVILADLLIRRAPLRTGSGAAALLAPLLTGVAFGIHPLRAESVAWISERKDVLCAFFYLLSLIEYVRYADSGTGRKTLHYAASLILFILSSLSKPMAVSLPVVLLLLDIYPLRRIALQAAGNRPGRIIVEKLPFAAVALGLVFMTVLAQGTSGQIRSVAELSLTERSITALRVLLFYFEKLFVPVDLAPFYPIIPPVKFGSSDLVRLAVLAVISAGGIFLWRRQKMWLTAWMFYVVSVFPTLGIVQVGGQAGADRYTYLPLLGPVLVIAVSLAAAAGKLLAGLHRFRPYAAAALILLLAAPLAYATRNQAAIWRDSISLWSREIAVFPYTVSVGYENRAKARYDAGDFRGAVGDYSMVIMMEPANVRALSGRGMSYLAAGDSEAACADFRQTILAAPDHYLALNYFNKLCR